MQDQREKIKGQVKNLREVVKLRLSSLTGNIIGEKSVE